MVVLEKNKIANTIEDFPEGKWVYAEPDSRPPKEKLWLDGARKKELIGRWHQIIRDNHLQVKTEESVTGVVSGAHIPQPQNSAGDRAARKSEEAGVPKLLGRRGQQRGRSRFDAGRTK